MENLNFVSSIVAFTIRNTKMVYLHKGYDILLYGKLTQKTDYANLIFRNLGGRKVMEFGITFLEVILANLRLLLTDAGDVCEVVATTSGFASYGLCNHQTIPVKVYEIKSFIELFESFATINFQIFCMIIGSIYCIIIYNMFFIFLFYKIILKILRPVIYLIIWSSPIAAVLLYFYL